MSIPNSAQPDKIQVNLTLNLTKEMVKNLDQLKLEYGAASRGRVIELLLRDLFAPAEWIIKRMFIEYSLSHSLRSFVQSLTQDKKN